MCLCVRVCVRALACVHSRVHMHESVFNLCDHLEITVVVGRALNTNN